MMILLQKFRNLRLFSARVNHLEMQKQKITKCKLKKHNNNSLLEIEEENLKKRKFLFKTSKNNKVVEFGDSSVAINSQINQQKNRMKVVVR